jgi:threonine dehydratase
MKCSIIVSVNREEYIALAILRLVELEKAIVEGAGATGLAAILEGLLPELKGKKYDQFTIFCEVINIDVIASLRLLIQFTVFC